MSRKRKVGILPKNRPALLSIVEEVFPRWRDRLRSSRDAADELEEFLRNPETRSAYVSAGEEAPTMLPVEFWRNTARLEMVPDLVDDRVMVDFTPYVHLQPDDTAEFFVRASDVERWESRHPELAAAPSAAPAVSEVATQDVSGEAQGADSFNTGTDGRPTASSREQQLVQEIAGEIFPGGYSSIRSNQLYKGVTDEQSRRNLPISKRDVVMRALGRRKG